MDCQKLVIPLPVHLDLSGTLAHNKATGGTVAANFPTILAAIDIGSNAIRLVIGERDRFGDIRILKKVREPVRLGRDVFASGEISEKCREKAIESFHKFQELIGAHRVSRVKAVATSALREARNRESFIQEVRKATGIAIEVIDGIEEGRLIFSAVSHRVDLHDKVTLLIDIGGGSIELTIADRGLPIDCQTFKLGTVRILQLLENQGLKEKHLRNLLDAQMGPVRAFLSAHKKNLHIDQAVGTGGNFECLGKLRVALLQKNSIFSMTTAELSELVRHLESMTIKERIQFLRLRPDRADVVVPAALATLAIMKIAEVDLLMVPYVGLRDGILSDLSDRQSNLAAK